jgi:S-formylglutathione hydrolase FrmB
MKLVFCILFLFLSSFTMAATVDTIAIYSPTMKKSRKCVVIKPDYYQKKKKLYPVVYLLHGYGGSYNNWINRVPEIKKYADDFEVMIVCPDGDSSSWYLDSPVDKYSQFETYIAKEVTSFIDKNYRTIKTAKGRAITGLSMGGHGALYLAFNNPDIFGACGSMSGGFNLMETRHKYDLYKRIGDTIHMEAWKKFSMVNIAESAKNDSLAIIFDCGIKDPFFQANKELHEKLLKRGIAHDYIERPGNHSWVYWTNSVPFHFLYFKKFFDKKAN